MEVREVWRQAHLKQPLGSRDGSHSRRRRRDSSRTSGRLPTLLRDYRAGGAARGGGRLSPTRGTSSRARPLSVAEPGRSMPRAGTLAPAAAPAPSFSAT